jgi:hypothetical protein
MENVAGSDRDIVANEAGSNKKGNAVAVGNLEKRKAN